MQKQEPASIRVMRGKSLELQVVHMLFEACSFVQTYIWRL